MGKAPEFLVELLVESTYRARTKTVPTELFADRFDFPSRYSLDIHLPKRGYQRLLTTVLRDSGPFPLKPLKTKESRINKGSPAFSRVLPLLQVHAQ